MFLGCIWCSKFAPVSGHADTELATCRFVMQRRMRVVTVPIPIAVTPREVFDGCDSDAVLAVLLHKLIQAAGEVRNLLEMTDAMYLSNLRRHSSVK